MRVQEISGKDVQYESAASDLAASVQGTSRVVHGGLVGSKRLRILKDEKIRKKLGWGGCGGGAGGVQGGCRGVRGCLGGSRWGF